MLFGQGSNTKSRCNVKIISLAALLSLISLLMPSIAFAENAAFLEHSTSWEDDLGGCELDGKTYQVGEMLAMNRKAIDEYKSKGGYVSDGEAIMMKCTYLVNPLSSDHPKVSDRDYRWVGFSWTM